MASLTFSSLGCVVRGTGWARQSGATYTSQAMYGDEGDEDD